MEFKTTELFENIPYMREKQALELKSIILDNGLKNCLELGFYHGKSSGYFAEILKNIDGKLTTIDMPSALSRNPNVHSILSSLDLEDCVTVLAEDYSYTWTLMKMLEENEDPIFDFVYQDGGHFWDPAGFSFFLIDRLLKKGGYIVFDDLDWTLAKSKSQLSALSKGKEYDQTAQVRKVWELLVKRSGKYECYEIEKLHWGVAKKIKV